MAMLRSKLTGMVAERSMVRRKETRFEGWGCNACEWVRPNVTARGEPQKREDIEAAFHLHRCERHPLSQTVSRESLN